MSSPESQLYEASPLQQRIWLSERLFDGQSPYLVHARMAIPAGVDGDRLAAALQAAIAAHPALRTTFRSTNGTLLCRPAFRDLCVERLYRSAQPCDRARMRESLEAPFDLELGPLFRCLLEECGDGSIDLSIWVHHIIWDSWSGGVFFKAVADHYNGEGEAEACARDYRDFAAWQHAQLGRESHRRDMERYTAALRDCEPVMFSPRGFRPAALRYRGVRTQFHIPAGVMADLLALGVRERVTPFMLGLTALGALVNIWSGLERFAIGSPVANRPLREFESMVGFFVNQVATPIDVRAEPTLLQLLHRVRDASLQSLEWQDIPFGSVTSSIGARDPGVHPVFQIAFNYLPEIDEQILRLGSVEARPIYPERAHSLFDLTVSLRPEGSTWVGWSEYDIDVFTADWIASFEEAYVQVLATLGSAPQRRVSEVPALAAARERLLRAQSRSEVPAAGGSTVLDGFLEQAARQPNAPAVIAGSQTLSYGELAERAGALADALAKHCVGSEPVIGVRLERGIEWIQAVVAINLCGASALHIARDLPVTRARAMLRESHAVAVVGDDEDCFGDLAFVPPSAGTARPPLRLASGLHLDQVSAIVATSGSTGKPMLIAVTHRNLANIVGWHRERYGLAADWRCGLVAGLGFDAVFLELWGALTTGAVLVIPNDEERSSGRALNRWLDEQAISICYVPTPLVGEVLAVEHPRMRALFTGGEALTARPRPGSSTVVGNHYGPTETTVLSTAATIASAGASPGVAPEIGRPVWGTECYVVDRWGRLMPPGTTGELWIGGVGVTRGYLHQPAATAERFVPDPFGAPGSRVYRTGDVVRWRTDQNLEFLGRRDRQIKLRGHRIELAEIETALLAQPGVRQATVTHHYANTEQHQLTAYVVTEPGVAVSTLRNALRATLPAVMVPTTICLLEHLPLTPNGKIDSKALPAPGSGPRSGASADPRPPATDLERSIAAIWAQLLKVETISRGDDFFALGGHSILATQVAALLSEQLERSVPLRLTFEHPTVESLAAAVEALPTEGGSADPSALPIRPRRARGSPTSSAVGS